MVSPHDRFPFYVLFETLGRKRKAYNCWSFFICEKALPCNDMIALSLRSLKKKKKTTESNMLEWDMVIAILQAEVGPTLPISFTKQILYVWECTNRTTTEEPNRKPDWRARPSVQRLCYGERLTLHHHLEVTWLIRPELFCIILLYFPLFKLVTISNF